MYPGRHPRGINAYRETSSRSFTNGQDRAEESKVISQARDLGWNVHCEPDLMSLLVNLDYDRQIPEGLFDVIEVLAGSVQEAIVELNTHPSLPEGAENPPAEEPGQETT